MNRSDEALAKALAAEALPLAGEPRDYDAVVESAGHAQVVLLGAASHGTHEFHRERARLTTRLIAEQGFTAVAAEADWLAAWRVNQFVLGRYRDADALAGFRRFPRWMWRNADVRDFVGWLRAHNDAAASRVGFHGLGLEDDILMADALDDLTRRSIKVVVWAHNWRAGDARATQAALRGDVNLGQLCRERRSGMVLNGTGGGVISVGFTTHHGTVSAASSWRGPVERKRLEPAPEDSYEELFHAVGIDRFLLDLRMLDQALDQPRLERAIGAVYPERYFVASLPRQFDFVVHIDETSAVEPLDRTLDQEMHDESS